MLIRFGSEKRVQNNIGFESRFHGGKQRERGVLNSRGIRGRILWRGAEAGASSPRGRRAAGIPGALNKVAFSGTSVPQRRRNADASGVA